MADFIFTLDVLHFFKNDEVLGAHALSGHLAKRQNPILHVVSLVSQNLPVEFLKSAWRHGVIDYYDKVRTLRILSRDTLGTDSVFIVDLNANIRGGFTNLTADYQKLLLEMGVGIYGQCKTWQIEVS